MGLGSTLANYRHMEGYEHMIEGLLYSMRIPLPLLDDARQEAYLGVLDAIKDYRGETGASLLTFANIRARWSVIEWIRRSLGRGKYKPSFVAIQGDFGEDAGVERAVLLEELRRAARSLYSRDRRTTEIMLQDGGLMEISKAFGVSVQRGFQLKQMALRALKAQMGVAA
jgi:RNA polymerase sigma factor (sigma-70 family)